jgi:TnsA-like endonuclease N terminal
MQTKLLCNICLVSIETRYKLINHVKNIHQKTWQSYILETKHKGITPQCCCGCNRDVPYSDGNKKYNEYLHGHNKVEFSDEVKKEIGKKNSKNMLQFCKKNPDFAKEKAAHMRTFFTDETFKKRKDSITKAYKNEDLCKLTGERSAAFWKNNPEIRILTSEKAKKTYHERAALGHYDAMKQNLSKIMSDKLLNNERLWQQGSYTSAKSNRTCRYKSSYELQLMKEMDANDQIASWLYEQTSISYIDYIGQKRRYIPDFVVNIVSGQNFMIEVKPKKLHERNRSKITAGQEYCKRNNMIYVLWEPSDGPLVSILLNHVWQF